MRSKQQKVITKVSVFVVGLFLLTSAFQNCSPVNFSAGVDPSVARNGNGTGGAPGGGGDGDGSGNPIVQIPGGGIPPLSCAPQLTAITTPVKLLFVVDVSGSNASNPGTDPNKVYRGGSIQKFFTDYGAKANFNWGFEVFNGTSARSLIMDAGNPIFTPSAATMQATITQFLSVSDTGNTPYLAALTFAGNLITNDVGRTPQTKYIVVFISDGLPNPALTDAQLKVGVKDVVDRVPGQVSFNTIYYGPQNPDAASRLYLMSVEGKGQFLDTNASATARSIPIANVVLIPGIVCQ